MRKGVGGREGKKGGERERGREREVRLDVREGEGEREREEGEGGVNTRQERKISLEGENILTLFLGFKRQPFPLHLSIVEPRYMVFM